MLVGLEAERQGSCRLFSCFCRKSLLTKAGALRNWLKALWKVPWLKSPQIRDTSYWTRKFSCENENFQLLEI